MDTLYFYKNALFNTLLTICGQLIYLLVNYLLIIIANQLSFIVLVSKQFCETNITNYVERKNIFLLKFKTYNCT